MSAQEDGTILPDPPHLPSPPDDEPIQEPPEETWEEYLERIGQDPDIVEPAPPEPVEPDPDDPDA